MSAVWRITLTWFNTVDGTFGQNVIHLMDPTELLTAEQIGPLVDDNFWGTSTVNGELRNFTAGNVRLNGMTIQRIAPGVPLGGVPFTGQLRTGVSGSVFHPMLGALFTLRDGGAGPSHRGRFYHYGIDANKVTRQGPTAGNITGTMTQWTNNMMARFGPNGSTGLKWVIWHRKLQGDARFTQITSITIQTTLRSQRRRNFGVGF